MRDSCQRFIRAIRMSHRPDPNIKGGVSLPSEKAGESRPDHFSFTRVLLCEALSGIPASIHTPSLSLDLTPPVLCPSFSVRK